MVGTAAQTADAHETSFEISAVVAAAACAAAVAAPSAPKRATPKLLALLQCRVAAAVLPSPAVSSEVAATVWTPGEALPTLPCGNTGLAPAAPCADRFDMGLKAALLPTKGKTGNARGLSGLP